VEGSSRNLIRATRVAQAAGDSARAAEAAARLNQASIWVPYDYQRSDAEVIELLESVLPHLDDRHLELRALVLGALSSQLHDTDRARCTAAADEAVAIARRLGDPGTLTRTLNNRNFASFDASGHPDRQRIATELMGLRESGALTDELAALAGAVAACTARDGGDAAGARRLVTLAEREAERAGSITLLAQIRFMDAAYRFSAGDLDGAEHAAFAASELYRRGRGFSADTIQTAMLGQIEIERGRAAEVAAFMEQMSGDAYASLWQRMLAYVYVEAGDLDRAARTLQGVREPLAVDWTWLSAAIITAIVETATGDVAAARSSYRALAPYAGRLAATGTGCPLFDAVDGHLAGIAVLLGDHDAAGRHFADAVELNERAGARVWLARTLVRQGEWLTGRNRLDEARAAQERARAIATSIGSVAVLRQLEGTGAQAVPN
jgi:tetratricopeptide (TPR) repeat protein